MVVVWELQTMRMPRLAKEWKGEKIEDKSKPSSFKVEIDGPALPPIVKKKEREKKAHWIYFWLLPPAGDTSLISWSDVLAHFLGNTEIAQLEICGRVGWAILLLLLLLLSSSSASSSSACCCCCSSSSSCFFFFFVVVSISGLSFHSPFVSPLLLLYLIPLLVLSRRFSVNGPFCCFFSLQKILRHFSLRDGPLGVGLIE